MEFLLDVGISGAGEARRIVADYLEWFRPEDRTRLTLFSCRPVDLSPLQRMHAECSEAVRPPMRFEDRPIAWEKLGHYYGRAVLVNEIGDYRRGELFRLFKLVNPRPAATPFDNQPIVIQYDIRYDARLPQRFRGYRAETFEPVADMLRHLRPDSVLDAGCGTGVAYHFLREVLPEGCRWTGLDQSRFAVIKAIERYERGAVSFQLGDITKLPFADQSFDLAFTESSLPYVGHPLRALEELYRVSRLGFHAALYAVQRVPRGHRLDQRTGCVVLETGATWKFHPQTAGSFHLPEERRLLALLERLSDRVRWRLDRRDQFFGPLGVATTSVFIYPRAWYEARADSFDRWNPRPLM